MRKTALLALLLCLCVFSAGAETMTSAPEALEQIRTAENIDWAGGSFVLLDGRLVDLRTGEAVLPSVVQIRPWDSGILACTADACLYTVSAGGACSLLFAAPESFGSDDRDWDLTVSGGVALLEDSVSFYCLSLKYGTVSELDPGDLRERYIWSEIWQDGQSGDCLILFSNDDAAMMFREDGQLLWRKNIHLVWNHMVDYVTDGMLAGYLWDERISMVLDPLTGEAAAVFPQGWIFRPFDGQYQIYHDHTALMDYSPTDEMPESEYAHAVVALDGRFLIRSGSFIYDRMPEEPYRILMYEDPDTYEWLIWSIQSPVPEHVVCRYDAETGTSEELLREPVASPDQIPDVVFDPASLAAISAQDIPWPETDIRILWEADGISFVNPDGTLLGGQVWKDIVSFTSMDGVEYGNETQFAMQGWVQVMNFEDKWGILSVDGRMILPAVYDSVSGTAAGFVARANGEVEIFDSGFNPVVGTR